MGRLRISQWHSCLAVRILASIGRWTRASEGDAVEIQAQDGQPEVSPVGKPRALDQLVADIADEIRHDEIVWGPPVGAEVW